MKEIRYHFMPEDIRKFATTVLEASGFPKDAAETTAHVLLEADKRGVFSHGLAGGTGLEEAVSCVGLFSTVKPNAKPIVLKQEYPTMAVIDANASPGHISSFIAVDLVKKLARKYGLAKVFIKQANHFGAAGVYSEMIAKEGDLVGTVTCTTSALVKPMGDDPEGLDYTKGAGKKVRIGTNPIAISIPHKEGILTVDMALTKMAANYCIKSYKTGEKLTIPEYAADEDYKSTLDPKEFIAIKDGKQYLKGSIFPLGSTHSGYKGDALLRFIELEHSIGGGALENIPVGSFDERVSLAFQAQVVDFHYSKDEALSRVKSLMNDYETKYFGPSTRWPGDRSKIALEYSNKEGIPYSDGQIDMLKRATKKVGLEFNKLIKLKAKKPFPKEIFRK